MKGLFMLYLLVIAMITDILFYRWLTGHYLSDKAIRLGERYSKDRQKQII